jgi:hypothetical protein
MFSEKEEAKQSSTKATHVVSMVPCHQSIVENLFCAWSTTTSPKLRSRQVKRISAAADGARNWQFIGHGRVTTDQPVWRQTNGCRLESSGLVRSLRINLQKEQTNKCATSSPTKGKPSGGTYELTSISYFINTSMSAIYAVNRLSIGDLNANLSHVSLTQTLYRK